MKKILLSLLALANCVFSFAKQVSEETAKTVGYNFLKSDTRVEAPANANSLQLVYKAEDASHLVSYYVFNTANGFVIVSGDDVAEPVLAYSGESVFDPANLSPSISWWMDSYKNDITYAITHKIPAPAATEEKWSNLKATVAPVAKATGIPVISPLVKTTWNQSPYYNYSCPFDNAANSRALTGCVATAMAQVMKYWSYPATGTGSHSYTPYSNPQYGVQYANFAGASYQWDNMTNAISAISMAAIDTIMYHAGVSVNMDYGVDASGAFVISSASPIQNCAEYALKSYFKYKTSLQGISRGNYSNSEWLKTMKMELNASRPVLYTGFGNSGGHCWVVDGYDVNDFLHTNWGWGGACNGYYSINAMNPSALNGDNFNQGQQAVIGITPGTPTVKMDLNAQVDVPTSISYNHPFSITTKFINNGTAGFGGDYIARVFDVNGTLVDSIQLMAGNTLNAGAQTNTLTFATTGSTAMTPGNYTIGVYYRPTGKTWFEVNDNGSYTNLIPVTVSVATAVNEVSANNGIKIFPNPANDVVNVEGDGIVTIRITDMQGRTVRSVASTDGRSMISIPLSGLINGIYFVQTQTASGIETDKIVVRN